MGDSKLDNEKLEDLLRVYQRATSADWADIEALLPDTQGSGLKRLLNYLAASLVELPRNPARNKRVIGERLNLIGRVLDRHIFADNTYASAKRDLRKILRNHFLSTKFTDKPPAIADKLRQQATRGFLISVGADEFDNTARMITRNKHLKTTRDQRHKDQLDISQEFIEDLCNGLNKSDNSHAILLLFELCTGARFGEIVVSSKFELAPTTENKRKRTVKSNLQAPPTVQHIKQTGLLKKISITVKPTVLIKPVLPYIDAADLLARLQQWRDDNHITQGPYDMKLVSRFRTATNELLREFIPGDYSTHILRAIYAVASYDLFRPPNMSENNFLRETLGHEALDVSLSYNHVNIIPNDE